MYLLNGRYKVIEEIGRGAESEVFICHDIKLQSNWAMKRIRKGKFKLDDCYREVNILKDLRHPNLPIVIDFFEDDEFVYIIRDYIEGCSLKDHILLNGPLDFDELKRFMREMIDIIDYLHNRKNPIIYRDIKPENIIRDPKGKFYLIDFGITRVYKHNHDSDTVYMGTKGYAAPELYARAQSDQRTDIYALGATIYYVFTGRMFSERDPQSRWSRKSTPELQCVKKIVDRATQLDPNNRYQNVLEIRSELELFEKRSNQIFKTGTNKVSIGVMGYKKGVGSTHISLLLGKSLSNAGFRVHIIDCCDDMGLSTFEAFLEREKISRTLEGSSYHLGKIKIFNHNIAYVEALRENCDYQIIDFGCDHFKLNEFLKLQCKYFVLPSNAWGFDVSRSNMLEEMNRAQDVEFLFNMDEEENYIKICKWLQLNSKKANTVPFIQSFHTLSGLSEKILQDVLKIECSEESQNKRFKFNFFRRKL